jgi:uncharacterized protein YbjT (DUF2867 family)
MVRQLLEAGHVARCLVRPGSEGKLPIREGIEVRLGDVTDPVSLQGSLEGCDALIHLVGIIREFPGRKVTFERLHVEATRNVVEAARAQGVGRYLQMSVNGSRPDAPTPYHRTKWRAEEAVRGSGLAWTIFRPSLIFGPGDQFVTLLAEMIRKLPVIPVIGDGRYRMSPVAVQDVATAFIRALDRPETAGQTYHCCGPEEYSYDEVLEMVGQAVGKKQVLKLHNPLFIMKPVIALFESIPRFPITTVQLTLLLEGNTCDPRPWTEAFAIRPRPFAQAIRGYLQK